jgi:hypothetical protein
MITDPVQLLPDLSQIIFAPRYDFIPEIDHFGLITKIDDIDFSDLKKADFMKAFVFEAHSAHFRICGTILCKDDQ